MDRALTEAWRDAGQPITVVQGGCPTGADLHARAWTAEHASAGIDGDEFPAQWSLYGRSAGMIRNRAMVSSGVAVVLAFVLDSSPGASHCVRAARAAGIPVRLWEATS